MTTIQVCFYRHFENTTEIKENRYFQNTTDTISIMREQQ